MATNLVSFHGLEIIIETPKGGERSGLAPDGSLWTVTMPVDYGYIRRTVGADGEQVDCYLGDDRDSDSVWIISQNDLEGAFDEHKVMLGFADLDSALATYRAAFSDGRGADRIGSVVKSSIADLQRALAANEFRQDAAAPEPLSDRETAEAIRDGTLPSPQRYRSFWLFALRITGTGAAYRPSIDEYAVRDPDKWLSQEFVDRCNGLPVIFEHPDTPTLDHKEFQDRTIGQIVLPYVKGDEVWGIAKIYDADAAALMQTTFKSTSPGVIPPRNSTPIELADGTKVLDEDLPLVLDHLAVCEAGVWDKNGPPEGVRLDSLAAKEQTVTEEERKKLEEERDDARRRADSAEAELKARDDKARKDAEEAAEKERADKAKKDADDVERKASEEKAKADKKRADRHDSEKHDGEHKDCAKCDAFEAGDAKKDGAPVETVDANILEDLKDSARKDSARIAQLETTIANLTKQPSMDDAKGLAAAFHRADALYQKLGMQASAHYPGESVISYRRRLADGLRGHSPAFKDHAIHDSISGTAFDHIENVIYHDAEEAVKNPALHDSAHGLREITTQQHGKTVVEFSGDILTALEPFMPPVRRFIRKVNKPVYSR